MTRILALSFTYPPHHLGGYEVICAEVMDRLAGRGHQVTVLTGDLRVPGVMDPPGERQAGVHRDLQLYYQAGGPYAPGLAQRLAIERANSSCLIRILAETRPEVVSVWHMGAVSLGLITILVEAGLPLVYSVCDDWLVYGPKLDAWSRLFHGRHGRRLRRGLGRALRPLLGVPTTLADVGASGSFCFISQATREAAESGSSWRFPVSTVVYSGIDRTLFTPVGHPGHRSAWRWRLLYVGRYDPRKGIETLVRALPMMPPARLEVQGRGDPAYRLALVDLAESLGVGQRAHFGAGVGRADLPALYAGADAVIFPSEWDEPFGLVPVEAMACAVPVVATCTGGSGEILLDGVNCSRFAPGDPADLARAVQRLAGDPAFRRQLTEGGLRTAETLDIERLTDTFEAWHEAARSGFAGGRPAESVLGSP